MKIFQTRSAQYCDLNMNHSVHKNRIIGRPDIKTLFTGKQ